MAKVMGSVARWTLMLALVASAFLYTLKAREETYDRFPGPGDGLWRTLNSNSLVFTRNWFLMGPAADNFLPNFNAYSIEKRLPPIFYVSYPPFFVFIPWAFSVVSGELPSLKLLMHLSLGAQAVTALLLLGFAYSLLCYVGMNRWISAGAAAFCGGLFNLAPASVFYFQNIWWPDLLVLPFFVAFVWAEILSDRFADKRWFRTGLIALVFLGCMADWLFHFLVLAVLFLRWISARGTERWKDLCCPLLAQLSLHLGLVLNSGYLGILIAKVKERTSLVPETRFSVEFGLKNWVNNVQHSFGMEGLVLYGLSFVILPVLLFLLVRNFYKFSASRKLFEAAVLLILPVHLHFLILRQHYYEHAYEVLKLSVTLPFLAMVLIPAVFYQRFSHRWSRIAVIVATVVIGGATALATADKYPQMLGSAISLDAKMQRLTDGIARNTKFEDIVISPSMTTLMVDRPSTTKNWDQLDYWYVASSYKEIYLVHDPEDFARLYSVMDWGRIVQSRKIGLKGVFKGKPTSEWAPFLLATPPISLGEEYFLFALDGDKLRPDF